MIFATTNSGGKYQSFNFVQFLKVYLQANSALSDQIPHSAASDLVLHCLSMSHKIDTRLKWVNLYNLCDLLTFSVQL